MHMLERMWGSDRPTLIIRPEISASRVCIAWLEGPPASAADDGTHLFVIWFTNKPPVDPLNDVLALIAQNGGWVTLAKGFEF